MHEGQGEKSDVKSELKSEDPTAVDDMVFSEEVESREVVVTSVEHHDPTAMSAGDEQEAEKRAVVPVQRKRAVSVDIVGEQEAKRMRSPRPLASPVPSPHAADVVRQAGWSKERTSTSASPGAVPARDS